MAPLKKARLFVVEDHPIVRAGLRDLMSREPGWEIVGEAGDAPQAIQEIVRLMPDLVIADIGLDRSSGLDLLRNVQARCPATRLVVYSVLDEALYAERALRAGAHGYVMKSESPQTLLQAVRRVLEGDIYVSVALNRQLLGRVLHGEKSKGGDSSLDLLSDREVEVFRMIGRGLSTREIAENLHLSPKTIESYRARLKEKLGVRTGAELTVRAVKWAESASKPSLP